MGNTSSVPGSASGGSGHKFTPSDGFFLSESAAQVSMYYNQLRVWAVSATDHSTPWHNAAERGHVDALQLLVSYSKQGALSNTFEPTSKACCQVGLGVWRSWAGAGGHTQAVQLLLAHGSNLFLRDKAGATALHYAALHPAGGCVPLLLKQAGLWGPKGPRLPATGNQQLAL
ncbi:hypothetical protein QJQ45_024609 [Haematococcus lacustris]|nr:hypothetical protein QJQ45_024609 [Haematococcus lacustris]